jgi:Holliday junction DNA helicase RuvB
MAKIQQQLYFFKQTDSPPSPEGRMVMLHPNNACSPYYGFIGNRKAVNKLIRIDFDALGKFNHVCHDLSVAFVGQAGCGKTDLARRHAKANGLPLVEISPKAVKTVHDIFLEVARVCAQYNINLTESGEVNNYILPPINIFIDEVHALAQPIVQGLLKATEHDDAVMVTEKGFTVDCRNVHWMIATTDRGKLFDAFDTRFVKIIMNLYSKNEIAQIIKVNYPKWSLAACQLVAHYCPRIPREALAFAREMELEYKMRPDSWENVALKIAEDNEIDKLGMTKQRLKILKALSNGAVAEKRLPVIAGVKAEELEKFILPWLMEQTDDQEPFIYVSSRGYCLTEAGIEELKKRNISEPQHEYANT